MRLEPPRRLHRGDLLPLLPLRLVDGLLEAREGSEDELAHLAAVVEGLEEGNLREVDGAVVGGNEQKREGVPLKVESRGMVGPAHGEDAGGLFTF